MPRGAEPSTKPIDRIIQGSLLMCVKSNFLSGGGMMTGNSLSLGGLVILVVSIGSLPNLASADEFCTQLKAIVGDASNNFSQFRGTQKNQDDESKYFTLENFTAKGWPVGAVTCQITDTVRKSSKKRGPTSYNCEFPINGENQGLATLAFAKRVASCLNLAINQEDMITLHDSGAQFLMDSGPGGVSVQIISGPMIPTIFFSARSRTR
jgi:hypothetical protein